MTNKEFRSDLAKEMRDKYDERNEQLEQIDKLPLTEPVKESAKKEIMENFYKEMDEMKTRPGFEEARKTYLEEIKARIKLAKSKQEKERLQKEYEEKLAKADENIAESRKGYKNASIAHRGKIEQKITENKENLEIPQDLEDFRKKWEEKIEGIDDESKEKIIKAAETIPVKVETESDGSRLIEFKLGNKRYKILDQKLKAHSDDEYFNDDGYTFIQERNEWVKLGGMMGDDVSKWENKKLAKYVKEKEKEGLHIAKIEEMKAILTEIRKSAGLYGESDQIAMLMYLTGMDGWYWLSMGDGESSGSRNSRSLLLCLDDYRCFSYRSSDRSNASLCLIACN